MNKAQMVDALAERLGEDKKRAAQAVEAFVDTVYRTVQKGEKVALTGFGVFEKRDRAARIARNPATGEKVRVKKTSVPAFRAGQDFKNVVSGAKKLPKVAAAKAPAKTTTAPTKATATRRAAAAGTATKTTGTKATARKTTAAKSPAAKATSAAKATTAKATKAAKKAAKSSAKAKK